MKKKLKIKKPAQLGEFVSLAEGGGVLEIKAGSHVRSHTVIYGDVKIGKDFTTGHGALIREGCRIGNSVSVGSGSVIEHHVNIGSGVRIHSNCFIPEFTNIADKVWIGPGATLTNARYPNSPTAKKNLVGPILHEGCIIGANATILPGISIGKGALVAAGSVVVKNVAAGVVVAGNPARPIKRVSEIAAYKRDAK